MKTKIGGVIALFVISIGLVWAVTSDYGWDITDLPDPTLGVTFMYDASQNQWEFSEASTGDAIMTIATTANGITISKPLSITAGVTGLPTVTSATANSVYVISTTVTVSTVLSNVNIRTPVAVATTFNATTATLSLSNVGTEHVVLGDATTFSAQTIKSQIYQAKNGVVGISSTAYQVLASGTTYTFTIQEGLITAVATAP